MKKTKETEKTFKYGAAGGLLGLFVGAPGLGVAVGVLAANKKPIKKFVKKNEVNFSNPFK